jgi:DNA-binding CsgD family transcriptional regulator
MARSISQSSIQSSRPLFDAVYEMHAAADHSDFMAAVAAGLGRLIKTNLCVVHVLDRNDGRLVHAMVPPNPFTAEEIQYYTDHSQENPLVAYYARTGDKKARRVSDVMPVADWLASNYYRHTLARLAYPHFLALPFKIDATIVAALSFNRAGRNFTSRDCALLDAFASHFQLAWQRHANPWAPKAAPSTSTWKQLRELGLTARESDVVFWITEGKQNREIAGILGLSLFTVQKHVANVLRKKNIESRHALTTHVLHLLAR